MAIAFKTALGSSQNKVAGTSLVLTTTAAAAIGDLVVVRVGTFNSGASLPTATITDSAGNTWARLVQADNANATAGASTISSISVSLLTVAIPLGGTITATLSASVTPKAMYAESFTGCSTSVRSSGGTNSFYSYTSGDIFLGGASIQSTSITGDTTFANGTWSTMVTTATSGGSSSSNVALGGQYVIATGTGSDNWSPTGTSSQAHLILIPISTPPLNPGLFVTRQARVRAATR